MNYSMYLGLVAATFGYVDSVPKTAPEKDLNETLEPSLQRLRQLLEDFRSQPASPQTAFALEQQLQAELRELGRVGTEWAFNHSEPSQTEALPSHVEGDGCPYTRTNRKTPQEIATLFGKIHLWRAGYRPTHKTGEPTLFPLAVRLGIVAGATPALAERAARYQAEAGATQRRTLDRLKQEHGVNWGVKKLREVTARVAEAMTEQRQEVQVEKLLQWLEQAWLSKGPHKPVLSVGRDGIALGAPAPGGTHFEVASAGTVSVLNRRGQRLGTVYLAYTPESKQGTMSKQLTQLLTEVLRRWERPQPRLCYVTDAGDNETTYYETVLRRMTHPRSAALLEWVRVVDYYHATQRLWTMADALYGSGPAATRWARRMQKLLKQTNGVRRVLTSAAVLRGRQQLGGKAQEEYRKAYNYLCERTQYLRYADYKRVGMPCGSGVTEAACKTIYTQRLKLSGMRWHKAGAQTILHLRVLLLSGVWSAAYQRVLSTFEDVKVPTYATTSLKTVKIAA